MKIVIAVARLDEGHRLRLTQALARAEVVFADTLGDETAREKAVAGAEVVFGNVPVGWLAAAPHLRWVQLDSAGVDAYLALNDRGRKRPILLTHLRAFYDRAVGEAAIAGILAFYRQLPQLLFAQRERRWVKPTLEPLIGQLHGKSIIILGAGNVGCCIEKLMCAFECNVRLFSRSNPAAGLHRLDQLDPALPAADVLINTLPHTQATAGLLDGTRLALLGREALFVNLGRGSIVHETTLLEALDANRLAGAVLDVTSVEPLSIDSPLWSHPRVILTQHTAGRFPGEITAKIDRFLANYDRFRRAEPFPDLVDYERGY